MKPLGKVITNKPNEPNTVKPVYNDPVLSGQFSKSRLIRSYKRYGGGGGGRGGEEFYNQRKFFVIKFLVYIFLGHSMNIF